MLQIWHWKYFQSAIDQLCHLGRVKLKKVFFRPTALRRQQTSGFPGWFAVLGWNSRGCVRHSLKESKRFLSRDILIGYLGDLRIAREDGKKNNLDSVQLRGSITAAARPGLGIETVPYVQCGILRRTQFHCV